MWCDGTGATIREYLEGEDIDNATLMVQHTPALALAQRSHRTQRLWDLSDIDKDGCLDISEFAVCMHLRAMCREGEQIPVQLPKDMVPPVKRALVVDSN